VRELRRNVARSTLTFHVSRFTFHVSRFTKCPSRLHGNRSLPHLGHTPDASGSLHATGAEGGGAGGGEADEQAAGGLRVGQEQVVGGREGRGEVDVGRDVGEGVARAAGRYVGPGEGPGGVEEGERRRLKA